MPTEMDTLKLSYHFDPGSPGTDDDPANPLSRALNVLLEDGRPMERMVLCFFGSLREAKDETSRPRWLGAFVLSQAGRIIFFPGFNGNLLERRRKSIRQTRTIEVDHFTLDKDFSTWHATSKKSSQHQFVGPTDPLGEGRYLWLSMSIASESVFREVKQDTHVISKCPASDSRRRCEVFEQAIKDADSLWVSLHPDSRKRFPRGFLHFAVIVGPSGFPYYEDHPNIPVGSPYLLEPIGDLVKHPVRYHRTPLAANIDIQITSIWLPSALRVPVAFVVGPIREIEPESTPWKRP